MRRTCSVLVALSLAVLSHAAFAQPPGGPPDGAPGATPAAKDTSGVLPKWMDGAVEVGVGWMASPQSVKDRYSAGMNIGLELQALAAPALRFGAKAEYHDSPSNRDGFVTTSNGIVGYDTFGDGKMLDLFGTIAVRPWRQLWLEGGAGYGHFESGFGDVNFIDGVTGDSYVPPGKIGWGPVAGAGARYEFQPSRRDRMYVGAGWRRMVRDDVTLQYGLIRVGYRFH